MFKVKEGKVEKVVPIFGQKGVNRDGSIGTYTDGVKHKPNRTQDVVPSSPAVISTKGYQ